MQKSWEDITPLLEAKLDGSAVRTRAQAGMNLSYVEAWHCIAEANRIFGYGCWNRETVYCKEVSRTQNGDKNKVGYEAKVKITVGDVVREGTGHGSQVSKDLFDAIEGAAKEAESDAMKRALMTFGNPFGLALYDKKQEGVEKEAPKPQPSYTDRANKYILAVRDVKTSEELQALQGKASKLREELRVNDAATYAIVIDEENNKVKEWL